MNWVDTSDIFTYDIFTYGIFTTLALTFLPLAILPLTFLPTAFLPLAFLPTFCVGTRENARVETSPICWCRTWWEKIIHQSLVLSGKVVYINLWKFTPIGSCILTVGKLKTKYFTFSQNIHLFSKHSIVIIQKKKSERVIRKPSSFSLRIGSYIYGLIVSESSISS